jgi:hypothetical protein
VLPEQLRMKICCFLSCLFLIISCNKNGTGKGEGPLFDSTPVIKPLNPIINEISGIADSKLNTGYMWGQEDSGTPTQLYLINHDGTVLKTIFLKNTVNRDWEDMALVDGQVYIAETGDNSQVYPDYLFYKFPEPAQATDTVKDIETIRFTYPDGPHDAEAFLVDPVTKDIFIITKRDVPSRIYKLAFPYGTANVVTPAGTLGYSGVVSAALSSDGKEIIVKTYTELFHYKRYSSQSITQALQGDSTLIKYVVEPQGEAISFAADNSGFYTVSEKGFASYVNLNFYKRK